MRMGSNVPVRLAGIGHYFPGEPVTNRFFEEQEGLGIDDRWIVEHTGVSARHWAGDDERHMDLAARAVRMALADAGTEASEVDLLIGTTATARPSTNPTARENSYADLSLPLQAQLGMTKAACFDVSALACAGFLHASLVVQALLGASDAQTAVVACAESPRPILNLHYRNSVLFGGGAAAAVWTRASSGACNDLRAGVIGSDGRHFGAFDIDPTGAVIMRGKDVSAFAPDCLVDAARAAAAEAGTQVQDIAWFVPHQANINLIDEVVERLGIAQERVVTNLSRRGNTSSVGVPGCLSEAVHGGVIRPGDSVLTCSVGRGFSWAGMVLSYSGATAAGVWRDGHA